MTENPIVNPEEVITPEPADEVVTPPAPLPGEKTDSALLLKSLKEEREKRRQAEAEIEALKAAPTEDVYSSEEGRALKAEIDRVARELKAREYAEQLASIQSQHPALKDKASEFQAYLEENKGMSMSTAAKAFLIENDLIETKPRKGLERDSGGGRVPVRQGRTEAEVAELRKNNFRQYEKELAAGTLWG